MPCRKRFDISILCGRPAQHISMVYSRPPCICGSPCRGEPIVSQAQAHHKVYDSWTTGAQDAVGNATASQFETAVGFTTAPRTCAHYQQFYSGRVPIIPQNCLRHNRRGWCGRVLQNDGTDPATTPGTCDGGSTQVNEGKPIPVSRA